MSNRKGGLWGGTRPDSLYGPGDRTPLLSPIGRVLIAILENPNGKLSELSPTLGVNESRISFALSSLVQDKILVRTRIAGKNSYRIHEDALISHPDMQHIVKAFLPLVVEGLEED